MGIASGVFTASLDVDPDRMVARDAAGRPLPPSPISPQGRKRAMWFSTTLYFAQTVSSAVTVLGALAVLRGRGYVLAVAGCLAAAVSPVCCMAGIPVAGWCLYILHRPDVRAGFD